MTKEMQPVSNSSSNPKEMSDQGRSVYRRITGFAKNVGEIIAPGIDNMRHFIAAFDPRHGTGESQNQESQNDEENDGDIPFSPFGHIPW